MIAEYDDDGNEPPATLSESVIYEDWDVGLDIAERSLAGGAFYYVGYNENFANYKAQSGLATWPTTRRVRIGLRHGPESVAAREDVKFDGYVIRIEEDGDVVSEADDVLTVASTSQYGDDVLVVGTLNSDQRAAVAAFTTTADLNATPPIGYPIEHLGEFVYTGSDVLDVDGDLVIEAGTYDFYQTHYVSFVSDANASRFAQSIDVEAARSVRINDGGEVMPATLVVGGTAGFDLYTPPTVSDFTVGRVGSIEFGGRTVTGATPTDAVAPADISPIGTGVVFAYPPDEHRDLPIDVFESDKTYTIKAWAVNEDERGHQSGRQFEGSHIGD